MYSDYLGFDISCKTLLTSELHSYDLDVMYTKGSNKTVFCKMLLLDSFCIIAWKNEFINVIN